jgi:hypothetical protein
MMVYMIYILLFILIGIILLVSYQKYKDNPDRFLKIWFVASITEFFLGLFSK